MLKSSINHKIYKFCPYIVSRLLNTNAGLGGSVGLGGSTPAEVGNICSFVEIDHEIFSTVILSLPLIQEGQLSVSGERMCTLLVNRLDDLYYAVDLRQN